MTTDSSPLTATTTAPTDFDTKQRTNPTQRITSVYNKAMSAVTDILSDARMNVRNNTQKSPAVDTTTLEPGDPQDQNHGLGGVQGTTKAFLARAKNFGKAALTQINQMTKQANRPPTPPPKDSGATADIASAATKSPALDQFKQSALSLANQVMQQTKQFSFKKKSPEAI